MKLRHLIIFLFVAIAANVKGQTVRTLFYTDQWVLTTRDSAAFYRTSVLDTLNTLFAGEVFDFTIDGKLVMKGTYGIIYRSDTENPLSTQFNVTKKVNEKHGIFTTYFPSGNIESKGEYKNNERVGLWLYFYPNGKQRYEIEFKDNLNFFVVAAYDASGKQLIQNGTGTWQYLHNWFGETKRVVIQGSFVNGQKVGDWNGRFNTGEIIYKETYQADSLISAEYAGAAADEKALFALRYKNKIPEHFKYEVTENFVHLDNLTRSDYPFLLILKKNPFEKEVDDTTNQETKTFFVVEKAPDFKGGLGAFTKFVNKNLKYPASAKKMNIEGTVQVSFTIEADGSITDIQIMSGISPDCDKEAARVISLSPKWIPGMQGGKPVRVRFAYPVKFKLR